jgi:AraC-like DNA-binding protein
MNEEQRSFIRLVDNGSPDKVMVKDTGREGIDLAPHSHDCIQLVETVTGTLRVTVGEREYFVPEGNACWIPRGTVHALTSHNRRIALRIFYFLSESDAKVADDAFSVHYVCPWAMANFRFVSPRTLSRLFSEAGTTFSDYLGYQRIIRSLELMADNTMPIKKIAYDTGFSSPANFNRAFKQVMGMPPSEMRRKQGIS